MVRKVLAWLSVVVLSSFSTAYAVEDGAVTNNMMALFSSMNSLFSGICVVVGVGLIFSSFIQYRQHRLNKLLVPISKPIFLLILGIVLACVPLVGHYTEGGQLTSQVDI